MLYEHFIEGECRYQITLLPECVDDVIGEDNPVRIVDAFVNDLNQSAFPRLNHTGSGAG